MLSRENIDHLAMLARINVSDQEKEAFLAELDEILAYVSEIQNLSGDSKPDQSALVNVNLREDEQPTLSGAHAKDLSEAFSQEEGGYLKVKKILPSS